MCQKIWPGIENTFVQNKLHILQRNVMEKKWMLRCSLHATVPNNVCNTDKDSYIKKHNPLSPSFSFWGSSKLNE